MNDKNIDYEKIFEVAPSWTTMKERECLAKLSREVPKGGKIMEIGSLYGGSTSILALANPGAIVIAIDEFSWTPEGYKTASAEQFIANMKELNIQNVSIRPEDSRVFALHNSEGEVDLLFIDGGHSFEYVYSDINNFGKYAKVIALHDFDNPFWKSVREAVERYMTENEGWYISETADTIVVLRRL